MITINLEKELIKQNKKLVSPKQELLIKEFDKFEPYMDNDVLKRIGLTENLKEGKYIKDSINQKQQQTQKFSQDRVLHISQIKSICEKFYLKFLPANLYEGTIDDMLPIKISTFEITYNEKCDKSNTYIIAPKKSFKLMEKPQDPLLFYQINDEYYYLIHKWGNDLNVFNRLKSLYSSVFITLFTIIFIFPLPFLLINPIAYIIASVILLIVFGVSHLMSNDLDGTGVRFYSILDYDSKYV